MAKFRSPYNRLMRIVFAGGILGIAFGSCLVGIWPTALIVSALIGGVIGVLVANMRGFGGLLVGFVVGGVGGMVMAFFFEVIGAFLNIPPFGSITVALIFGSLVGMAVGAILGAILM